MQASDLAAVRTAINGLETLPADTRQVFLDGLPGSIAGTGGLLLMAALEDARGAAAKATTEAEEAAGKAESELETCRAALQEAETVTETSVAEAQSAQTDCKAASKAAKEADADHKKTEKSMSNQAKGWQKLREDRERASSVLDGSFKMLETGGWEDEEIKSDCLEAVEKFLKDIGTEKVLVAAAPAAIGAKPEERKPFDKMVVEETADELTRHLKSLDAKIAEIEPEEQEANAELLGLWAIAQVAGEAAAAAQTAAAAAEAEKTGVENGLALGRKRLREVETSVEESKAEKVRRVARAAELEEAFTAAERLKSAPPPAAAAAVEPEPATVAEDAAPAMEVDVAAAPAPVADVHANEAGVPNDASAETAEIPKVKKVPDVFPSPRGNPLNVASPAFSAP